MPGFVSPSRFILYRRHKLTASGLPPDLLWIAAHPLAFALRPLTAFAAPGAACRQRRIVMRPSIFVVIGAIVALVKVGCAASFRAGGDRGGVDAGAAIGPSAPP